MTPGEKKGYLLALAGNALVATNFVTAKIGLTGFNVETFSLLWGAAATVYTAGILAAMGRLGDLAIPRSSVPRILFMGFATAVGMILGWAGLALLTPSYSALLWRFAPVMTIALGVIFLKDRLSWGECACAGVMVAGGVACVEGKWEAVGAGTLYTLLACLANSVQMLSAKSEVAQVHPNALVFYRASISTVFLLAWVLLLGRLEPAAPVLSWAMTFLGGFIGPCLSFLLTFRSYRYLDLSRASFVSILHPVWAIVWTAIFLGERPTARELAGGAVIMAGAVGMGWIQIRRARALPLPLEAGE